MRRDVENAIASLRYAFRPPAKRHPRLHFLPNLDATQTERPVLGDCWAHEIKWDGYRAQAHMAGGKATVYTRNGNDWTERFPTIAKAMSGLRATSAIVACLAVDHYSG